MEHRSPIYFNVLAGTLSGIVNKTNEEVIGKPNIPVSLRWFNPEPNPAFFYPHILISCPHNKNKRFIREALNIPKDCNVFVDSGGFQLATQIVTEKEYNKEIALAWSEENGTIFPILDMPVSAKGRTHEETLNFSVESAIYYAEKRTNPDCKILNVLSANRRSNMDKWYERMKGFPFEGWAYGGHKNYATAIIQSILFLESKGEFNKAGDPVILHMFGTTSYAVMPYILYAQHILDKKGINCLITFDSSSASALANYGKFVLSCSPSGIQSIKVSNSSFKNAALEGKNLGCDCPVCSGITNLSYMFSDEGKWQYYPILGMHNFYKMLSFKNLLEGLIRLDNKDLLESFPTFMVKNFKAMDKAFSFMGEAGIDIIQREFNIDSGAKPIELSGSTNSLESFF